MNEMILRTIFKKKEIQMSIGRKELIRDRSEFCVN